ncbi:hypothetical protein PP707_02710, partial [Acetobacter pasteurianus]|nr:hypothetical protein [Acetobacter pasteurianus]
MKNKKKTFLFGKIKYGLNVFTIATYSTKSLEIKLKEGGGGGGGGRNSENYLKHKQKKKPKWCLVL